MPDPKKKPARPSARPIDPQSPKSVSVAFAKAHFSSMVSGVQKKRTPITVLRRGVPVARLVPLSDTPSPLFGSMRGTVQVLGDIVGSTGSEWALKAENE